MNVNKTECTTVGIALDFGAFEMLKWLIDKKKKV